MIIQHQPAIRQPEIFNLVFSAADYPGLIEEPNWGQCVFRADLQAWLDRHLSGEAIIPDRGDWGEGTPIFTLPLKSRAAAEQFVFLFGAPSETGLRHLVDAIGAEFGVGHEAFCNNGQIRPEARDWLEQHAAGHRLEQVACYAVPYAVFRLVLPDRVSFARIFQIDMNSHAENVRRHGRYRHPWPWLPETQG